jgi:hypothetical protein
MQKVSLTYHSQFHAQMEKFVQEALEQESH